MARQSAVAAVGSFPLFVNSGASRQSAVGGLYLNEAGATALSLAIDSGTYTITGNAIALTGPVNLAIASGSYAITGNAIALSYSGGANLSIDSGVYTLTGNAIGLFVGQMPIASGVYTLTGNSIGLSWSGAARRGGRSGMGMGFGTFGRLGAASAPFGSSVTAPSSVSLTAFPVTGGASAGVQRDIGFTTGSPIFAGTYSGGTPTGFQGRVRKVSDNSTVKDWTTLTNVTFGSGTFTGKVAGVPQGAGYYRDVRPLNATGVTATDSTPFMIGIGLALYGQSNMNGLVANSSSPPAANAATAFFDGPGSDGGPVTTGGGTHTFIAVPSADGIRTLLNTINNVTGVPCFGFNAARTGTSITALVKGQPICYAAWLAGILAMQGCEFILWRHAESGAAGTGTQGPVYLALARQLHIDITTDIGLTTSQVRFIASGLAPQPTATSNYAAGIGYNNDIWDISQAALKLLDVYSHSNMDATLGGDQLHETGASEGRSGARYARTITTLLGSTSGYPNPSIASGAVVDATHTTIDITHGFGTDFTPSGGSNITGFEASGDGGITWVTCTAVRTNATRITLTHASLTTTSNRKIRYQYGALCDVSAAVIDNSSLNVPLLPSAGMISPTPLSTLPVPAFQYCSLVNGGTNLAQTLSNVPLGAAALNRMAIVGLTMDGNTVPSSIVITPNVGSAVTLTVADNTTTNVAGIYYGALLSDADTATSCTVTVNFASAASTPFVSLWTVDRTALSSQTPVSTGKARSNTASALSISPSLTSTAGGFNIAVAFNGSLSNTVRGIAGTETYATQVFAAGYPNAGSASHIAVWTSNVSAHTADSVVTATYDQTDTMAVVAASWR